MEDSELISSKQRQFEAHVKAWVTHPNSVYLGQQFGIILLHSLQTLKHGRHMRLTQQEGVVWRARTQKKQKQKTM